MPTLAFHAPGITDNGLHATTNPTAALVATDLGVDTSSPFNYHFGLIDSSGNAKGVRF